MERRVRRYGKFRRSPHPGLIVINGLAAGEALTVQHRGEGQSHIHFAPDMPYSSLLSRSLSPSISPPVSHSDLIRENKRVELISAGLPGESEAKSAINSIFIHPCFVLLGELSQRSLSGWESRGIKKKPCTDTQR